MQCFLLRDELRKASVFSESNTIKPKAMADPVTDQPSTTPKEEATATPTEGGEDGVAAPAVSSWWGVTSLSSVSSYLASPHLLEQGINNVASSMAQVTSMHRVSQFVDKSLYPRVLISLLSNH